MQKARKTYTDSRVRRNLNSLNNELQDVQRIMVQNIDDVLQRGTVLSGNNYNCPIKHIHARIVHYMTENCRYFPFIIVALLS